MFSGYNIVNTAIFYFQTTILSINLSDKSTLVKQISWYKINFLLSKIEEFFCTHEITSLRFSQDLEANLRRILKKCFLGTDNNCFKILRKPKRSISWIVYDMKLQCISQLYHFFCSMGNKQYSYKRFGLINDYK